MRARGRAIAAVAAIISSWVPAYGAIGMAIRPVSRVPAVVPSLPASALTTLHPMQALVAPAVAAPSLAGQTARVLQGAMSAPAALPAALDAVFDNAARPAAAVEAEEGFDPGLWDRLQGWVARELDVKLPPGKALEWARRSRDVLRQDPTLPFEKAMAEGLGRAYPGLGERALRDTRTLLEDGTVSLIPGFRTARFLEAKGRLYALDDGLYMLDGRDWKRIDKYVHYASGIYQHDGVLLLCNGHSAFEVEGDKLKPVLPGVQEFRVVADPDGGSPYVSTHGQGVFRREPDGQWRQVPGLGRLWGMVRVNGQLFAATADGLCQFMHGRWVSVFAPGLQVTNLAAHGDTLYFLVRDLSAGNFAPGQTFEMPLGQPARRIFEDRRYPWFKVWSGRLYAMDGESALLEWRDGEWTPIIQGQFHFTEHEDGVYLTKKDGFFLFKDGVLHRQEGEVSGFPGRVHRFGGRAYIGAEKGLYEGRGGAWAPLVSGRKVWGVHPAEKGIYFSTGEGTFRYGFPPAGVREAAMKELGASIGLAQDRDGEALAYVAGREGDIEDEEGRPLFSGLGEFRKVYGR